MEKANFKSLKVPRRALCPGPHKFQPAKLFADSDRDGVANVFDCQPHNPRRQDKTYKIKRFYRDEGKVSRTMQRGLNLKEAQAHCSDPKTRKEGVYFDGYTEED